VVIVQQIIRFLKAHPESVWVRSIPGADVLHLSDDDPRTAVVVRIGVSSDAAVRRR
jgi:hypothetical protein